MGSIVCYNSDGQVLEHYFQWDSNQTVTIKGITLPPIPLFHVCNRLSTEAYVVEPNVVGTDLQVDIPNYLFTQAETILMYVYSPTPEGGYRTIHAIMIPVIPRPKPDDYVYEDNVDYISVAMVDARVTNLINELSQGSTGDISAEVIDIRTAYDGTIYDTAGDAVRSIVPNVTNIAEFAGANAAREVVPALAREEALKLIDPAYVKLTASGEGSVSFGMGGTEIPVVYCNVSFEPQQDLNGQPAPYIGGAGRNLFNYDGARVVAAKVNLTQERLKAEANMRSVVFRCEAGETYTVSCASAHAGIQVGTCADNPQVDETMFNVVASGAAGAGATITAAASDTYLVATIYNAATDSATPADAVAQTQIEKGSTATEFVPYENVCPISPATGVSVTHRGETVSPSTTYNVSFPEDAGTVYGGTVDVVSGDIAKEWESLLLDGTSTYGRVTNVAIADGVYVGWLYLGDAYPGRVTEAINPRDFLLSDKLESRADYRPGSVRITERFESGRNRSCLNIVLPDQSLTTVAAINSWLANNNVLVVYKVEDGMADEFESEAHDVNTFYGVNNMTVSNPPESTINVKYRADTGLYLDSIT